MRNVSYKVEDKIKTPFHFQQIFPKIVPLWNNVEKIYYS